MSVISEGHSESWRFKKAAGRVSPTEMMEAPGTRPPRGAREVVAARAPLGPVQGNKPIRNQISPTSVSLTNPAPAGGSWIVTSKSSWAEDESWTH